MSSRRSSAEKLATRPWIIRVVSAAEWPAAPASSSASRSSKYSMSGLRLRDPIGVEHPVDPDRDAQVLAKLRGQGQVGEGEAALGRLPCQGQHAVAGDSIRDRDDQQRRRAEQHQQRCPVRGGAEHPGIVGAGQHHGPARGMDLGGHRPGRGVDAAYRPGQLVRPLAVRAVNGGMAVPGHPILLAVMSSRRNNPPGRDPPRRTGDLAGC